MVEIYNILYAKMDCPYCSNKSSKVTNKRKSPEGIRRRRECLKCKKRFTTYEKVSRDDIYIIKRDGRREKFDALKLAKGIHRAFEKRPVSKEVVEKLVFEIEESMRKKGKKEIRSSFLGELVMKKIRKIDNVAYIRFASVYKNFQDVSDFRKELRGLNG